MFNTVLHHLTPLDHIFCKPLKAGTLGWAGPFPPERNGAAAVTYWTVRSLLAQGYPVAAVPPSPYVVRKYFSRLTYARISSRQLRALLFVCADEYFARMHTRAQCPVLTWQTVHKSLDDVPAEMNIFNSNQNADHVVLPTKFAYAEYKKHGADNISYVPFGVDTTLFSPAPKPKQFTVLFVSRLCYYKGINQFLDAIPLVHRKRPDIKFRIVGQVDRNPLHFRYEGNSDPIWMVSSKLAQVIRQYPTSVQHTTWVQYTAAHHIYQNASVLVMPSCSEGFGVPLIEAMSCGVPIVTVDLPPMNEIVYHNKTGICLPPDNCNPFSLPLPASERIAEKILALASEQRVYDKMSKTARDRVLQHYDMSTVTKCLMDTVRTVTHATTSRQT